MLSKRYTSMYHRFTAVGCMANISNLQVAEYKFLLKLKLMALSYEQKCCDKFCLPCIIHREIIYNLQFMSHLFLTPSWLGTVARYAMFIVIQILVPSPFHYSGQCEFWSATWSEYSSCISAWADVVFARTMLRVFLTPYLAKLSRFLFNYSIVLSRSRGRIVTLVKLSLYNMLLVLSTIMYCKMPLPNKTI